ncbi:saccharopine dehydrogenase NADP-binding domain-containing protein [Thermopolyspora sp. NPDC052614]|uniref:saccharopine dehydrogenase NADP-binding domain-containing protein n=1 Tax=Thermopolyspora sp. NPDC052614 TaxID=3155682 RepID=UPI003448E0B2
MSAARAQPATATEPVIGLIGGYGDVGGHAARFLRRLGGHRLRVGGRDLAAARRFVRDELHGEAEAVPVDCHDDGALDRFAAGCHVLVNCSGPSRSIADRAAWAASRAGAHYIDAGGDDALHRLLGPDATARGRAVVLSAGLRPGLTGLLPRWAAHAFDQVRSLTAYLAVLDRFTRTAADDYVRGADDGVTRPLAAWRDGPRPRTLTRRTGVTLPFLPAEATLLPYLDTEGVRLAEALGLSHGDWHTALVGEHVRVAFDRVHTLDREQAVTALCEAARLDAAGRTPFAVFLAQLDGVVDGTPASRTVLCRGPGSGELTGAVTALSAVAAARGEVPPGRHFAADVLDPVTTINRLRAGPVPVTLSLLDTTIDRLSLVEEGVL